MGLCGEDGLASVPPYHNGIRETVRYSGTSLSSALGKANFGYVDPADPVISLLQSYRKQMTPPTER